MPTLPGWPLLLLEATASGVFRSRPRPVGGETGPGADAGVPVHHLRKIAGHGSLTTR